MDSGLPFKGSLEKDLSSMSFACLFVSCEGVNIRSRRMGPCDPAVIALTFELAFTVSVWPGGAREIFLFHFLCHVSIIWIDFLLK